MYKENIGINKIERCIRSAGLGFLGIRMEDLLLRTDELEDKKKRTNLINEYYQNQIVYYDENITGTIIRVESAIQIIKADMVLYTLERIAKSTRTDPRAILKGRETLRKIESGELALPHLY